MFLILIFKFAEIFWKYDEVSNCTGKRKCGKNFIMYIFHVKNVDEVISLLNENNAI